MSIPICFSDFLSRVGRQTLVRLSLAAFGVFLLLPRESLAAENPVARGARKNASANCFQTFTALPIESRILGVRNDPLAAFENIVDRHFPRGVPFSETAFALDAMRANNAGEIVRPSQANNMTDDRPSVPNSRLSPAPVRTISLDVFPVSSPGKIDWNQLVLEVHAYDRDDRPTTMRGTLRASLWGQSQQLIRSFERRVVARPGAVQEIATWTRSFDTTRSTDPPPQIVGPNTNQTMPSLRLFLPLPYPLPDHDLRLAPVADLHVQLLVPGQGIFEATRPSILLRQASALRDRNLVQTGSRFLSSESTHDNRRPTGLRIQNPSSLWPNGSVLSVQP